MKKTLKNKFLTALFISTLVVTAALATLPVAIAQKNTFPVVSFAANPTGVNQQVLIVYGITDATTWPQPGWEGLTLTIERPDGQVETFDKWKEEGLDKLLILGAFEEEIESALRRSKHDKDIISIENLGWMENIITCKFNTNAKGLIPAIGKILPKARFEIFSPSFIRKALKDS